MTVDTLADLVRSELNDLADTGGPSPDLADRAVAAGVRRVRRRYAAAGGAVLAAAVAVTLAATPLLAPTVRRAAPAAAEARNVVFATFEDDTVRVLNPATGEYRTPDVGLVMEPSADLRYAPVLPRDPVNDSRIGRYDTVTGEIRWFPPPRPRSAPPTISPDGRYLVVPFVDTESTPGTGLVFVDTEEGAGTVVGLPPETVAAAAVTVGAADFSRNPPDLQPRKAFDLPLHWHADSRHVLVGNAVVDVNGRRTATLPMPDGWLVAPRPDGRGTLAVPADALDTYVVTDGQGGVAYQGRLDWTCTTEPPPACPRLYFDGFIGWRGDRHILVKSPDDPRRGIDSLDLRTGKRERVRTYDAVRVLVTPADRLSPGVRDAVSF